MKRVMRAVVPALLLALWPGSVPAQTGSEPTRGVGVVTTLAGTATVARAALPSPRPLSFKDDVFVRDHIATAEKSIVRVLLGGKALITVRELSSLTIKEETGRSAVDLSSGKIAMGVVRQRMRPGEAIEIRTPNAIVAVRGTVLVVELIPAPGGTYTTKVHVLHGLVEVSDPNNPGAPPTQVGTMQSWSRTGGEAFSPTTLPVLDVGRIFADLTSGPQITEGPSEFMTAFTAREQARAVAVAEFLAPEMAGVGAGGDGEPLAMAEGFAASEPGITSAPVNPTLPQSPAAPAGGTTGPGPTGQARLSYNGQTVTVPGSLYSLGGGQTDSPAVPILETVNSSLTVARSLMDVAGGSTFASTGTAPLLYLDPSTLGATSVLTLGGGARFSLSGSLLRDDGGTLSLGSDMLSLSGGGTRLTGTGTAPLVDLVGSTAGATGNVLAVSGGAVLDLLQASAPLLNLTQRASLTAQRLAALTGGANVQLSQLTALSASSLTLRADALSLSGGARLAVTGDLFRLGSGSTLTISNGALLNLSGGATLSVGGALINFLGTGNTLSITNNLCGNGGCVMIGNLPVFVRGGGTVTLNNPVLNLAGNNLNITPGSAVISVTGNATVRQGL